VSVVEKVERHYLRSPCRCEVLLWFCISVMGICIEWKGRNRREQLVEMNGCVKVILHTIKRTLIMSALLP
jgi:hypothetical protein